MGTANVTVGTQHCFINAKQNETIQYNTTQYKVNGCLCASTYLDSLEDVVSEDGYRDAETFDICFRYICTLAAVHCLHTYVLSSFGG